MKKMVFLLCMAAWSILAADANYSDYYRSYRTWTSGDFPVLSMYLDRENSFFLPSVLPELEKGTAYIENNGTNGGIIVPMMDRKFYFHTFMETDVAGTYIGPREMLMLLTGTDYNNQGDDEYVAPLDNIFGIGFSGGLGGLMSFGANLKLYANSFFSEATASDNTLTIKNAAYRLEFIPSVSFKLKSLRADTGIQFYYQWISNSTNRDNFEYPYDYTGNLGFSLFGRMMFDLTQWTQLNVGLTFGYMGASNNRGSGAAKTTDNFDRVFLAVKPGLLMTPLEWLTLGTSITLFYNYTNLEHKTDANQAYDENNDVALLFSQTADFKFVDWFTLKAGFSKQINFANKFEKVSSSVKNETDTQNSNFGKMIGCAFDYKGFNLTMILNFDLLTKGPNIISGNTIDPMAFAANLSYSW